MSADERDVVTRAGIDPLSAMTPEQLALYDVFRAKAQKLKSADVAYREAQVEYADAVKQLSEAATR